MKPSRLQIAALAAFLASLSFGTALAAECASAPMRSDDGIYNGCEIVHGADVQFRDAESITEEMCPKVCEALNEIDELAKESLELDEKAGFGSLAPAVE